MNFSRLRAAVLTAAIVLIPAACTVLSPTPTPTAAPTATPEPPTATSTITATPPPTETPTATSTLEFPTLAPTTALTSGDFLVRVHPDGALFPGDLVSFEIIGPQETDLGGQEALVALPEGAELGRAGFGGFGIAGRQQATLQWAWDTTGLESGEYPLTISVLPDGIVFTHTVTLLPESLKVFPEPDASWASAESDCCLFYYITGTAAERDLEDLMAAADREAELTIAQLGGAFDEVIEIVFLPRVLGHGGFAGNEIYISYLDRNYAGNGPAQVLHHEMVHILDGRKGGDFRPSLFVEGLAVYLSGGHFKKEPIVPRAAAVRSQDTYIPLAPLADDFYSAQHEISYLQGAALIEYMVMRWGWDAFDAFYRDIHTHPSNLHSAAINQALDIHFSLSFDQLEADFIAFLEMQPFDAAAGEDIRLSVLFFDTLRRYQQAFDPSAYFLTAWLLGIREMLEREVVADYLRHPTAPENIALETLLLAAEISLGEGDYDNVQGLLDAVHRVLDAFDSGSGDPFHADPLAADFYALVLESLAAGYEPQQILHDGETAVVIATAGSVELVYLEYVRTDLAWQAAE